jgi:hypothetical protein
MVHRTEVDSIEPSLACLVWVLAGLPLARAGVWAYPLCKGGYLRCLPTKRLFGHSSRDCRWCGKSQRTRCRRAVWQSQHPENSASEARQAVRRVVAERFATILAETMHPDTLPINPSYFRMGLKSP